MKDLRQHAELFSGGYRLQTRDDGNIDALRTKDFYKIEIFLVVEEHLRGDVFGAGIHLFFEIHQIGIEIRSLEMLFRITCDTDTKIGFSAVFDVLLEINTLIETRDLFEQIDGVTVSVRLGFERGLIFRRISPQYQHIVDSKEMQIDQRVFRLTFGKTAADKVRNRIDLIVVHDRGANTYRARTFPDLYLFECSIRLFLEHRL